MPSSFYFMLHSLCCKLCYSLCPKYDIWRPKWETNFNSTKYRFNKLLSSLYIMHFAIKLHKVYRRNYHWVAHSSQGIWCRFFDWSCTRVETRIVLLEVKFDGIYSVSQKKSTPRGPDIFHFFHKRFRIFNQFLTHLLYVPIYARIQIFIQLSLILTKLCHIKSDYL